MSKAEKKKGWRRWVPRVLAVAAVILVLAGQATPVYNFVIGDYLERKNEEYLDTSIEKATDLLVPVAVVKATVDIIEGSTIVGIEFGDIMQPLLEYIDIAFRVLVAAVLVLLTLKTLLPLAPALGGIFLFAGTVFCVARVGLGFIKGPTERLVPLVQKIGTLLLLLSFFCYLALPLTVLSASKLRSATTEQMEAGYTETFTRLKKLFALDEITGAEKLNDKAEKTKEKAGEVVEFVQNGGVGSVAMAVFSLTVVHVLDAIVFPLLSFLFLWWLFASVLAPGLGLTEQRSFRSDLAMFGGLMKSRRRQRQPLAEEAEVDAPANSEEKN